MSSLDGKSKEFTMSNSRPTMDEVGQMLEDTTMGMPDLEHLLSILEAQNGNMESILIEIISGTSWEKSPDSASLKPHRYTYSHALKNFFNSLRGHGYSLQQFKSQLIGEITRRKNGMMREKTGANITDVLNESK